jgi:hypothetical protein
MASALTAAKPRKNQQGIQPLLRRASTPSLHLNPCMDAGLAYIASNHSTAEAAPAAVLFLITPGDLIMNKHTHSSRG